MKPTERILHEIVKTKHPANVNGVMVDMFTAHMLVTVINRLTEENKEKLLNRPTNEMVMLAYKILTQ